MTMCFRVLCSCCCKRLTSTDEAAPNTNTPLTAASPTALLRIDTRSDTAGIASAIACDRAIQRLLAATVGDARGQNKPGVQAV